MSKFNKGDKVYHKETGRVLTNSAMSSGGLIKTKLKIYDRLK